MLTASYKPFAKEIMTRATSRSAQNRMVGCKIVVEVVVVGIDRSAFLSWRGAREDVKKAEKNTEPSLTTVGRMVYLHQRQGTS